MLPQPTLADLRASSAVFVSLGAVDRATAELRAVTGPRLDLSREEHRDALLAWLNAWGCRIRTPRPGEPRPFQDNVAAWWHTWGEVLPDRPLARLRDADIARLGEAFTSLAALPVTAGIPVRTLSATATAKALHALRSCTVMPWDAAIATALHGSRDGEAFARHQALGRAWARGLLAETGLTEPQVAAAAGRGGASLAKLLDEHCYVRITYVQRSQALDAPDSGRKES